MSQDDPFADLRPGAQPVPVQDDPYADLRGTPVPPPARWPGPRGQTAAPGPVTSGDPAIDMFSSPEAWNAPGTVWERGGKALESYGQMGKLAADSGTYGLGNRALAGGRSAYDAMTQGGGVWDNYGKYLDAQNQNLEQTRQADPDRAVFADILGGAASGSLLAKGGITLAKPAAGWIERAARGTFEGGLHGAAQGAGSNYDADLMKKARAASMGAILGGGVGVGLPLAGSTLRGAGALAGKLAGHIPEFPIPFLRSVDADRTGVAALANRPGAMLPDAGPSMLGLTQGAASSPGPGRSLLHENLRTREAGTGERLAEGRDRLLGPAVEPAEHAATVRTGQRALSPEYEAAYANSRAVDSTPVAHWLETRAVADRGEAQAAAQKIRSALNITGTDVLDPDPRTLHAVREMIDDMRYPPGGGDPPPGVRRVLDDARGRITQELHDKVPGLANVDAKFAEQARRGEAFQAGRDAFGTGKEAVPPRTFAAERRELALPAGSPGATVQGPSAAPLALREGANTEINRIVGTSTDDLRGLENTFRKDFNARKLADLYGIRTAEEFQTMLRDNREFRETYQKVVHGSKTADTLRAAADAGEDISKIPTTLSGVGIDFVNRIRAGFGTVQRNRIAELMATQGQDLSALLPRILQSAEEQARQDMTRTIVENAARRGSTTAFTDRPRTRVNIDR